MGVVYRVEVPNTLVGEVLANSKGVHRRWNLKEAGGKTLPRGTRISSGITNRIRLQYKSKSKDYTDVGM